MKKAISCLISGLILLITYGCISINQDGYKELSAEERAKIVKCENGIDDCLGSGANVYAIRAEQLLEYLGTRRGTVLVYEYIPFCTSKNCKSPVSIENLCKNKGMECVVVSCSYERLNLLESLQGAPLVVDYEAYGTHNYQKLARLFFDRLTGTTQKARNYAGYHLFKDGKYIKSFKDVESAVN